MREQNKTENDLISVIIPLYNVEAYLPKCIESVQLQTYTNLEIILVDDGSTDGSSAICDTFAQTDARIKVIHKENGGVSDARNTGLDAASGKYMFFVDSDDYIGPKCIQYLHEAITKSGAQIAVCDYVCVSEHENGEYPEEAWTTEVLSNEECLKRTYLAEAHGLTFMPVAKLCELDLFRKHNIRYPAGKIHEDTFETYKLLYYAEQIAYISSVQYYYRQRTGSIMHTAFGLKNMAEAEAEKNACEFFKEKGAMALYMYAYNSYLKTSCRLLYRIQKIADKEMRRGWSHMVMVQFRNDLNYRDLAALGFVKAVFYSLIAVKPMKCLLKLVL